MEKPAKRDRPMEKVYDDLVRAMVDMNDTRDLLLRLMMFGDRGEATKARLQDTVEVTQRVEHMAADLAEVLRNYARVLAAEIVASRKSNAQGS